MVEGGGQRLKIGLERLNPRKNLFSRGPSRSGTIEVSLLKTPSHLAVGVGPEELKKKTPQNCTRFVVSGLGVGGYRMGIGGLAYRSFDGCWSGNRWLSTDGGRRLPRRLLSATFRPLP